MKLRHIDFKPIFDDLLIVELRPDDQVGGIIIPDTAKKKQSIGLVVATGHGRIDRMTGVIREMLPKHGDVVKFRDVPDEEILVDGMNCRHIKEFDIEGFYIGDAKDMYIEMFKKYSTLWEKDDA